MPLHLDKESSDKSWSETTDQATECKKALPESLGSELTHLLVQCKTDDQHAFQQLYLLSAHRLNGIAFRIIGNIDSANEVLQEAFIQIWQNRHRYHADKSQAFTWLVSIVRYRAYDRLRYDKCRCQDQTIEFNEFELNKENTATINAQLTPYENDSLDYCLNQLESNQRQSILMAYLYGYSRNEISTYFNTPINTIKSWIRRGLGRLLSCLNN
ncbi:RNA polymerase sigma factor [Thalassotalea sp. ND16A]|uniref:RNA polymerase sigma factor n=1 Tax=Thalassotalea sp. ND16A TaxID=1535422 RepID=UPI00051D6BC4|nr:sigma-70 family RNA polymerase sigma factor [Thalassotalea sp. ND16A]KGJ95696.1 RNA polymerase, sigma-24 subunit, ECF subfamily [Thalassotalea sp. ND16A]